MNKSFLKLETPEPRLSCCCIRRQILKRFHSGWMEDWIWGHNDNIQYDITGCGHFLSLLNCYNYNEVEHILSPQKLNLIHRQWGSFELCQIRNLLVSSFRTEVSRRVYGLNWYQKNNMWSSVVQLIRYFLVCEFPPRKKATNPIVYLGFI